MTRWIPALALGLAAAGLASGGVRADERVGITSAVNPAAIGTPPGGTARPMVIGGDVMFRERVITTAEGQAQLLFLDQSALMVGPNSQVVIDEFVYDPNAAKGAIAATLAQGSFRYIGGKLSKQGNATLRTPVATIGIRGSDVTIIYDTVTMLLEVITTHGLATVTTAGGSVQLRTGFRATVNGPDGAPSASALTAAQIAAANAMFEGYIGKAAGAPQVPRDADVARSGLESTVEAQRLAAIAPAAGGGDPPPPSTPSLNDVIDEANDAQTNGQQTIPPPPPPPPSPPSLLTYSGRYKTTIGDGTGRFGTRRDGGSAPTFDQPAFNAVNSRTFSDGVFAFNLGNLSVGDLLSATLDGEGASLQPDLLSLVIVPDGEGGYAAVATGPDGTAISNFGQIDGESVDSVFLGSNGRFFSVSLSVFDSAIANFTGDRLYLFGGTPVSGGELLDKTAQTLRTYALQPDPLLGSGIPFIRNEAGGGLENAVVSPLYVVNPDVSASGAANGRILQASLAIDGEGASQQSAVVLYAGSVFREPSLKDEIAISGSVRGTALLSAAAPHDIIRMSSGASTVPESSGRSFFGETEAEYFVLDENGMPPNEGYRNSSAFEGAYARPTADVNYGFNHVAVRDAEPAALGQRTDRTMNGYVGGVSVRRVSATNEIESYTITNFDPAQIVVQTMPTSGNGRVFAEFNYRRDHVEAIDEATARFGSPQASSGNARSAFIDDERFGAVQEAGASTVLTSAGPEESSGSLNGEPASGRLYMFTAGLVDGFQASFPNVQFCTCEFVSWGFWGGELRGPIELDNQRERIHLGTWVAGVLPDVNDVPTGTATFSGHAIGTVLNNGAQYTAAGTFTNAYNFGQRTGNVTIQNFDGRTLSGTVGGLKDWRHYEGNLAGPQVTGAIHGSFYGTRNAAGQPFPMNQPKETAGNFTLNGEGYSASGTFAASR